MKLLFLSVLMVSGMSAVNMTSKVIADDAVVYSRTYQPIPLSCLPCTVYVLAGKLACHDCFNILEKAVRNAVPGIRIVCITRASAPRAVAMYNARQAIPKKFKPDLVLYDYAEGGERGAGHYKGGLFEDVGESYFPAVIVCGQDSKLRYIPYRTIFSRDDDGTINIADILESLVGQQQAER